MSTARNRFWATNRFSHCTHECCTCPNNSRVHLATCSAGAGNTGTVCHNDDHIDKKIVLMTCCSTRYATVAETDGHVCTNISNTALRNLYRPSWAQKPVAPLYQSTTDNADHRPLVDAADRVLRDVDHTLALQMIQGDLATRLTYSAAAMENRAAAEPAAEYQFLFSV